MGTLGGMRRIRLGLWGVIAVSCVAAACAADGEALIRVSASEPAASAVDRLRVHVFEDGRSDAILDQRTSSFEGSLPQSFRVRASADPQRTVLRVRVTGLEEGRPAAAGDGIIALDPTSSPTTTIELDPACVGVVCPRLQRCVADAAACDGACHDDAACSGLLGCGADSRCDAIGGRPAIGQCIGQAADLDADGFLDVRCPLAEDARDCDDTDPTIPSAGPACGDFRDHDCDGERDEEQLCGSACSDVAITTVRSLDDEEIDADDPIRAIAGLRLDDPARRVFVLATDESVRVIALSGAGLQSEVASMDMPGVRQAILHGPLLALGTDDGLRLLALTDGDDLVRLGRPVGPGPVDDVVVAQDTAWITGPGLGLIAVDVTHPELPRELGRVEAPEMRQLTRMPDGVLAVTLETPARVLFFPAEPGRAPSLPIDVTGALGLDEGAIVTALATRDPRPGVDGGDRVVAVAGQSDGEGFIRLHERNGDAFPLRGEIRGRADVVGLHLDAGVLVYVTALGAAGAALRDPAGGGFREGPGAEATAPGMRGSPVVSARSTTVAELPVAVFAQGEDVRIVSFGCE